MRLLLAPVAAVAAGWVAISLSVSAFRMDYEDVSNAITSPVSSKIHPIEFQSEVSTEQRIEDEHGVADEENFLQIFSKKSKELRKKKKKYEKLKKAFIAAHSKEEFKMLKYQTMINVLQTRVTVSTKL